MRSLLFVASYLFSNFLSAQHLNFAGHLIDQSLLNKKECTSLPNGTEVMINGMTLQGNAGFKTASGYVTLMSNDDDSKSIIRIYDNNGKTSRSISFRQTINFSISPDKKFAAFHDTQQICLLNFETGEITKLAGSSVFSFSSRNTLAFYNEKNQTVNFEELSVNVNELVNKLIFYRGNLLIVTRTEILQVKEQGSETLFSRSGESIFDVEEIEGKLFVSTKKVFNDRFEFTSFSSSDLQDFQIEETINYPLAHSYHAPLKNENKNSRVSNQSELIRDPIYFFQDTVYQPIGNSYDEMQDYSGGVSIYPHPGVDLLGVYLQDVSSVKHGYVRAILTTSAEFHWRIAVANKNTADTSIGYLYAHLEETSIPYTVGDSVNEGDFLGQLVDFPVAGFVHCHFARIYDSGFVWNGAWWTFDNPLSYMTNFFDTLPPVFEKTIGNDEFAFRDSAGSYLSSDSLYGKIKVISKVYDQINSSWHVDVNKLRYNLSSFSNPQTLLLDTFAYEFNFHNDNYGNGVYMPLLLHTIYSLDPTCYTVGNYNDRNFYHIITNSDGNDTIDATDSLNFFDTRLFPDGDYIFRIIASDPSGNSTTDSMFIRIKNLSNSISPIVDFDEVIINPNPFSSTLTIKNQKGKFFLKNLCIKNVSGQNVSLKSQTIHSNNNSTTLDLSGLSSGVYFISFEMNGKIVTKKIIRE